MLETEIAARRPRQAQPHRRMHYDCIVKEGVSTVWCPRRFVLCEAGFCLEDQEGPASAGNEQPWEDITSIDAGDNETHLHEAVLILRRSPGYLHVRFFDAYPLGSLQEHWTACTRSSFTGATVPAVIDPLTQDWMNDLSCLVEGLRSRKGQPAIATHSVNTMPMSNLGATPPKVYDEILRGDGDCTILRVWRAKKASEMVASPWEPLEGGGGHLRGIRFRMPLKPRPMAPKSSRFVVAYHLSSPDERPIVLTEISRTLDVPYSSSFEVHNQHVFRELPPEEGGILLEDKVGINWTGRCMIKSIIESASRQETAEATQAWSDQVQAALNRV